MTKHVVILRRQGCHRKVGKKEIIRDKGIVGKCNLRIPETGREHIKAAQVRGKYQSVNINNGMIII